MRDCLVWSERRVATPDLRRVAWHRLTTPGAAEVCLWRIAASYQMPQRVQAWMDAVGLSTHDPYFTTNTRQTMLLQGGRMLNGLALSHVGGTSLFRWLNGAFPYRENFSVTWDGDGHLISAQYNMPVL